MIPEDHTEVEMANVPPVGVRNGVDETMYGIVVF